MGLASTLEDMFDSWNERDHLSTGKMPRSPMDSPPDDQQGNEMDNPATQDDRSERKPLM